MTKPANDDHARFALDRQGTALLAAVGHDLRTPLTGIKAAVKTLRQADIEWSGRESQELLRTIEQAADRLDAMVANLLDASRLQARALSVRSQAVGLDEMVGVALLALPDAPQRVELDVPEDLPLVHADLALLERVLINILDNALRHGVSDSPIGVVASTGGETTTLEIIDHGPGISREQREWLFEPSQRLGDRGSGAVGLGLTVACGFIEAMGGAIVADRTPGGGLTIRIRLPLAGSEG